MIIYNTRYKAQKHADANDVIVKVDAGNGEYGYTVMSAQDYHIWKKQK